MNEDVIDYELLEDLIIYIDEEGEAGSVLVFLPVSVIVVSRLKSYMLLNF